MSKTTRGDAVRKMMADLPPGSTINITINNTFHVAVAQDVPAKDAGTVAATPQTANNWALSIAEKLGLAAATETIKRAITGS